MHVTLKLATSLDGRIALSSGESRWITGQAAREEVQDLRAAHDVVMIGAATARADNPSLLARTNAAPERQPARVVVTTRFGLAPEGRLFEHLDASPLIVFGAERAAPAQRAILEAAGAVIRQAPRAGAGGLDMSAVMAQLRDANCESVLLEGGGQLAAACVNAFLVSRIEWFRAPILLGAEGRPALGSLPLTRLADAPRWRRVALRELGADLWESYERAD